MKLQFITGKMGECNPPCSVVNKNLSARGRKIYKFIGDMAVGLRLSFALKHFLFLQVNYASQNYGSSWQYPLLSKHFDDHENIKLPYLFGYKPISAISRDPKLLTQKINLINTNCKCIILGYKPRAIFGLEVYRRP